MSTRLTGRTDTLPANVVVGSCGKHSQSSVTGRFTSRDSNPLKRPRVVSAPLDTALRPVRALTSEESVLTMTNSVNPDTYQEFLGGWQLWEEFAERNGFDVYFRGYDEIGKSGAVCLLISTLGSQETSPEP